ncbi:MAG: cupredoxin domain-containing protein [Thermoanaerobaculia bacterium]
MIAVDWTTDRILALAGGAALILFLYRFFFGRRAEIPATAEAGSQTVEILVSGGYRPDAIVAKKGVPLRLVFDRRETNPCSDEIVISDFGIRRALPPYQKTMIELLPQTAGEIAFTCGMNMLHGKIRVVD